VASAVCAPIAPQRKRRVPYDRRSGGFGSWRSRGPFLSSTDCAAAHRAKPRAHEVRGQLKTAGIAEDKIELAKPERRQGSGNEAAARRVEIILIKQ
jgi:hypothetical protein